MSVGSVAAPSECASTRIPTEWSLLLEACSSGDAPDRTAQIRTLSEAVRWKTLLEFADRHSVLPLLYRALFPVADAVPKDQMRVLHQLYQTNVHKSLLLSRELIQVVDRLSADGIEVLPYKGVALAEMLYGDMALRQSGDIDLLIRPRDLHRIRQSVSELGYVPHIAFSAAQERAYLKAGYEYAFDGAAGRNLLEVQWAIQPGFYAVDFDQEGLFKRASSVTVAGHEMKTAGAEDLFLILSLHAAKHAWARLIWISDIARLVSSPALNWEWIASQGKALGIVRILRVGVILANRLLKANIPPPAEACLPPDFNAAVIAAEVQTQLECGTGYDVESAAYFRLMLRLRERPRDRVRFLNRLVFTSGPNEWAAISLPDRLFPLYRVVRLFRLAGKLTRA